MNGLAPVLVIGFRRLAVLQRVLQATVNYHDGEIFVFLDHARPGRSDEEEQCASVREWVEPWASDHPRIHVRLAEHNVGLARAIPGGIDWVLGQGHDSVIVLEDDCLPAPSFFPFMQETLSRYAQDDRVMMISGGQLVPEPKLAGLDASYYFSRFVHVWGWATWRRAWQHYDHTMSALDDPFIAQNLDSLFPGHAEASFYSRVWKRQKSEADNAWASRWLAACLLQRGLCICPARNLVRNIGFGEGSTHTMRASRYQVIPLQQMDVPLKHPSHLVEWRAADRWWFKHLISKRPLPRLLRYLRTVDARNIMDEV